MGTDGGAVHESHAERKVAPLDEFEQAPRPDAPSG